MIFEEIRDLIASRTTLSKNVITMQALLKDDLSLDSFDLAELAMELEDTFEVTILDEQLVRFQTVSDIVAFIEHQTIQK
ncbi:MAG: acyl carrier protein [Clostridium sp.]|uniref:acyl carrier protein n=1 Tax=Clostridium sp. TaxID=1506 RepID=UPI002914F077|nr:acyl carrier protein [Clostridium sp.]MDU7337088.1 acyl carrier protein [Clostridium sp.]